MSEDTQHAFDAGAQSWAAYNLQPLGRIRREVTWHNLVPHLPAIVDPDQPPHVLDAGGGSGELALRLVQHGYRVWLLDYAPAMLEQARLAAQDLPAGVGARLSLSSMAIQDAPRSFAPGFFDAITCHTLIEYLPEPRAALHDLTGLLGDRGLLSLSFVNRHAGVLRQVWSRGDPVGALASLDDGSFCATLFDLPGSAYTAEEMRGWLSDLGLSVAATRGVRIFADYVPRQRLEDPGFFDDLLRLELTAAGRRPFNQVARYMHLIARKPAER